MMRMKRTRNPQKKIIADAILISDLHLTDSTPVSRTDDYIKAQKNKLLFLQSLSAENKNCPVLCAGDVFDYWKASPWLCSLAYNYLPRFFIGIPGQHDLPGHSLEQYERSGLGLINSVSDPYEIRILDGKKPSTGWIFLDPLLIIGRPFGTLENFNPEEIPPMKPKRKILILHELTWKGRRPPWDKAGWTDLELIDTFGGYFDLILTGDNHFGFATKEGDCVLVNPGSMMRMNADQEDYQPRCYLYYANENEVSPVYFPIEKGVHNREHLDRKKERDERIAAYIERMGQNWEAGLSFRRNLESFFAENNVTQKVREIIWHHLETGKV